MQESPISCVVWFVALTIIKKRFLQCMIPLLSITDSFLMPKFVHIFAPLYNHQLINLSMQQVSLSHSVDDSLSVSVCQSVSLIGSEQRHLGYIYTYTSPFSPSHYISHHRSLTSFSYSYIHIHDISKNVPNNSNY